MKFGFSVIGCGGVTRVSCSKNPRGLEPDLPPPDEEVALADLKINTLSITPENDSRIYGTIAFVAGSRDV